LAAMYDSIIHLQEGNGDHMVPHNLPYFFIARSPYNLNRKVKLIMRQAAKKCSMIVKDAALI
jgi:hypothetical protein